MTISSLLFFLGAASLSSNALKISILDSRSSVESSHRLLRLAAAELNRYSYEMHLASENYSINLGTFADAESLGLDVPVVSSTVKNLGYSLSTSKDGEVMIFGSDPLHVLYGSYTLLEKMGCTFSTAGPTVPMKASLFPFARGFSVADTPVFTTRGLQPFHDFAEGPDWWSVDEVNRMTEAILSMKGNIIAFHTYPLQEPAVWVGLNSSIDLSSGNVTFAYPTRWATTLEPDQAWGYNALATEDFGYGASQIFEHSCFGHPTVSGNPLLCPEPKTPEDSVELFNRVGLFWKSAFSHAALLSVQTILGTEMPLSLPPAPSPNNTSPILALQLWYSSSRDDHFVTTTSCEECENLYEYVGSTGWVYANPTEGTVPIYTYYNGADNMLTTATTPPAGYNLVRTEGYILTSPGADTTELYQYYNSQTLHHWALDSDFIANATKANFAPVSGQSVIGYVLTAGPKPSPELSAFDFYVGTLTRLEALHGSNLSYYWSWTPEGWEWDQVNISNPIIQDAVKDSLLLQQAHDFVNPSFKLATCGWTVGPLGARWYYDSVLPSSWVISSIDMDVGNTPVDPAYANITHRSSENKWAIPWAEDDPGLTAPELWVNRSLSHARDANAYEVGGLLSIHWRTRMTSPQIASAHASAWNISLEASDFWSTFVLGQFSDPAVSSAAASIFASVESFNLPRPVNWIGGPGGLSADASKCNFNSVYSFVDAFVALRPQLLSAISSGSASLNNLERFDYWAGQFVYMRQIAIFECNWASYASVIAAIDKITDPTQKQQAARTVGVAARISLQQNGTIMVQDLLATVSTIEGSGTIYNLISHGMWNALGPQPTAALVALTGEPLPANALAPLGYDPLRPPQLRIQTVRTMLASDEAVNLRAIVIVAPEQAPTTVTLFTAPLGSSTWTQTPLQQSSAEGGVPRFVYGVTVPNPGADFQWFVRADLPANTTAYSLGLGIPAGTTFDAQGVHCFFPPGGESSPQSVVVIAN